MIRVDDDFMREVGLQDMAPDEKADFMRDAEEELEVRIGQKIGENLTEEQLDEFDAMTDLAMAADWLDEYVPNYRALTEEVFANFKQEIAGERAAIMA